MLRLKENKRKLDGEMRQSFSLYPERKQKKRLNRKPEKKKDLFLRSETVRKSWRHLLLAGVSLLQHELENTGSQKTARAKGVGVSKHGISSLLSLLYSLTLLLLHFRPRLTCVSLSVCAQSRKLSSSCTSSILPFLPHNIIFRFFLALWCKRQAKLIY